MKNIFRILIITFLLLSMQVTCAYSETVNLIEEKLDEIGVPNEYIDNIINYITNLKLSDEERNNILEKANNIVSRVKEKEDYKDFTITELLNIYDETLDIADELDINLDLDLSTKKVVLKDKDSKLILIKCDIDDIKRYYKNYKESPITSKDYEELRNYILENTITNDENIKSSEANNNSNMMIESDNYDKNDLNHEEIAKNRNLSDNSNSTSNNNENLNKADAIKRENINRVFSIIFLVIFACVVISLLIDSIFFIKEN